MIRGYRWVIVLMPFVLGVFIAGVCYAQGTGAIKSDAAQQAQEPSTMQFQVAPGELETPAPQVQQEPSTMPLRVAPGVLETQTPVLKSIRLACVDRDVATLTICKTTGQCSTARLPCFPYHCDDGTLTCATSCSSSDDCWLGTVCLGGRCVVQRTYCEGNVSRNTAGEETRCEPYICDASAGTCRTRCTTSADCVGGYVCDTSIAECVTAGGY